MKTITMAAIGTLMAAAISLSATAYAQDAAAPAPQSGGPGLHLRHDNPGHGPAGRMGGGDFFDVSRGAEAVEVAFVRLGHRIELTAEQQPLFDAFKTAALSAAADFATTTEGLRPAAPAQGTTAAAPDFSKRLDNRIAIETARLAALEAVQPSAKAFFDSLTEEQRAQVMPMRPGRDGGPGHGKFGGPRAMEAPVAPATPPANG